MIAILSKSAEALYSPCKLCHRLCAVNRAGGESGYCGESAELRIACAGLHRGEEPLLIGGHAGTGGSGAIFVSGCNLGCVFCQNRQITGHGGGRALGRAAATDEFVRICAALKERGAANINIVTGSHAIPALAAGIRAVRAAGIDLPVLWNSSAYEDPCALEMLRGLVDIFLPDLKTLDRSLSARLFNAPDYPEAAAAAITKMLGMVNDAAGVPPEAGRVMVRHLVLPGELESTRTVLRWFAGNCAGALLSLMFQYTPLPRGKAAYTRAGEASPPARFISEAEYHTVIGWLGELGIEEGFAQELTAPDNEWLPDFSCPNPFPRGIYTPVWSWLNYTP
ncbi:MAG: radical SAM protein [Treponema sp.]|nr:radical SAM protein [Treponema sp.]